MGVTRSLYLRFGEGVVAPEHHPCRSQRSALSDGVDQVLLQDNRNAGQAGSINAQFNHILLACERKSKVYV